MKKKNNWNIKIRANRLAWGLLLIACAVLLLLDACGVSFGFLEGIPFFTLLVSGLLVGFLIAEIFSARFHRAFFTIAFLFMVLEKYIAGWIGADHSNLINNWLVLLIAFLLSVGTSLLRPRKLFRRSLGTQGAFSGNNHNTAGSSTVYIDCTSFTTEEVTNEFGSCQIFFSNVKAYEGGGKLLLRNEFGAMKVHVPKEWKIKSSLTAEFGALFVPDDSPEDGKVIEIVGKTEMGALKVIRV